MDVTLKDCEFPTSIEQNLIASLIEYSMELHEKDLQMFKDKFEERKCFSSNINKTFVERGNDENSEVRSQPETTQSTTLVEDDTEDLINFR